MDRMASIDALSAESERARIDSRGAVRVWLLAVAALVLAMVLVGGATRLTESGLSITEWKPVTGVLPPLSAADWQAEFDRYKQIPQYSRLNPDMTLDGFKTIFWWEWSHRLLARVIGFAYVLPALWFWARGAFKGALGRQVALATALLALEPIVGWWMVSSGLGERAEVAQDRLAMHLLIAAGVLGTAVYAAVGSSARESAVAPRGFVVAAAVFALLVYVQLGLGALVAGLRAGLIYNTWPLMGDRFLPGEAFGAPDAPVNDPATAQFDHRLQAYAVLAFALVQAFAALRAAPRPLIRRTVALAAVAAIQGALGVMTLLFLAPIPLALAHQAVALVLFGLACAHWSATRRESTPNEAAKPARTRMR
jgi:cytochrome c oxidase assembly protein subunit 15